VEVGAGNIPPVFGAAEVVFRAVERASQTAGIKYYMELPEPFQCVKITLHGLDGFNYVAVMDGHPRDSSLEGNRLIRWYPYE
jgi:hypothetical protein